MPIVLYKLEASPPCRAVSMIIEMLGLKVETIDVDLMGGETRTPAFIAKTPLHKIPLIEDGDFTLGDSHAIITYLVSKYGADKRAQLYPSDLAVRATVDQRLYMDATILFPGLSAVFASFMANPPGPTAQQVADIEEAYGFLETYLQASLYLAHDGLTLADVSCVATLSSLNLVVPIDQKYSKLNEWFNRIKQQEWYQKGNGPGLAISYDFLNKLLNKS